jgi:hypothetical protein
MCTKDTQIHDGCRGRAKVTADFENAQSYFCGLIIVGEQGRLAEEAVGTFAGGAVELIALLAFGKIVHIDNMRLTFLHRTHECFL